MLKYIVVRFMLLLLTSKFKKNRNNETKKIKYLYDKLIIEN